MAPWVESIGDRLFKWPRFVKKLLEKINKWLVLFSVKLTNNVSTAKRAPQQL